LKDPLPFIVESLRKPVAFAMTPFDIATIQRAGIGQGILVELEAANSDMIRAVSGGRTERGRASGA
jgi:hypothetical protein